MPIQLRDHDAIRKDVREHMARKNISLRELVRISNISRFTVGNFLKGRSNPHDQTLIKLCLVLDIPWSDEKGAEA